MIKVCIQSSNYAPNLVPTPLWLTGIASCINIHKDLHMQAGGCLYTQTRMFFLLLYNCTYILYDDIYIYIYILHGCMCVHIYSYIHILIARMQYTHICASHLCRLTPFVF